MLTVRLMPIFFFSKKKNAKPFDLTFSSRCSSTVGGHPFFFFQNTAGTIVCCSTSTPGAVPGWLWNGTIFSLVSSSWGVRQMTRSHSPVVCSFRSSGVISSLVNPFLLSCFSLAFPLLFRYNCAILSATPCFYYYAASGIFSIGGIL